MGQGDSVSCEAIRLYQISKNYSGSVYDAFLLERGLCPGVETVITSDVVDALDAYN
jgi:hypothetical protein